MGNTCLQCNVTASTFPELQSTWMLASRKFCIVSPSLPHSLPLPSLLCSEICGKGRVTLGLQRGRDRCAQDHLRRSSFTLILGLTEILKMSPVLSALMGSPSFEGVSPPAGALEWGMPPLALSTKGDWPTGYPPTQSSGWPHASGSESQAGPGRLLTPALENRTVSQGDRNQKSCPEL